MKKYNTYLILLLIFRVLSSVIFGSVFGVYAEIITLSLFALGSAALCYKLKDILAEGDAPGLRENIIATVTFSGLLLLSVPVRSIVGYFLPALSGKTNVISRLSVSGIEQCVYIFIVLVLTHLFVSVATVKAQNALLNLRTILIGGLTFALTSLSLQSFPFDFVFGCFITGFLLRYGSIAITGCYIFLYKGAWIAFEFLEHSLDTYSEPSGLLESVGMFVLFASVLLLGIYLELRFVELNKKTPLMSIFSIAGVALLIVIGCAVVNYAK